jgi:hydroxymethylbilane synthase
LKQLLAPLHDAATARTVEAERFVNQALGGSCHTPIAIYCKPSAKNQLTLDALIASPDGQIIIQDTQTGPADTALLLAAASVTALKAKGALALLNADE